MGDSSEVEEDKESFLISFNSHLVRLSLTSSETHSDGETTTRKISSVFDRITVVLYSTRTRPFTFDSTRDGSKGGDEEQAEDDTDTVALQERFETVSQNPSLTRCCYCH